jgi:hypothetical protein
MTPKLQSAVTTHVRSSLAARDLDVCVLDDGSASPPLATLEVTTGDAEFVTSLVVRDDVTRIVSSTATRDPRLLRLREWDRCGIVRAGDVRKLPREHNA